jgi:hypothetical protein
MFGAPIGKGCAFDVGMKFGFALAEDETGMPAPYGEPEYGVWYGGTDHNKSVSDDCSAQQ